MVSIVNSKIIPFASEHRAACAVTFAVAAIASGVFVCAGLGAVKYKKSQAKPKPPVVPEPDMHPEGDKKTVTVQLKKEGGIITALQIYQNQKIQVDALTSPDQKADRRNASINVKKEAYSVCKELVALSLGEEPKRIEDGVGDGEGIDIELSEEMLLGLKAIKEKHDEWKNVAGKKVKEQIVKELTAFAVHFVNKLIQEYPNLVN